MPTDAEKVLMVRHSQNLNQKKFAEKLHIALSTLTYVEKGERKCPDSLKLALLKVYGYDIDSNRYIQASKDAAEMVSDKLISIPFYRISAAAGAGLYMTDEVERETLYYDKRFLTSILPKDTNFKYVNCITASGDSMMTPDNKGIKDGDILFVDTSKKLIDNGVYIIIINNELRVKRLIKKLDNTISIQSDNSHYLPEIYNPDTSPYSIAIIGKVIWNSSKNNL